MAMSHKAIKKTKDTRKVFLSLDLGNLDALQRELEKLRIQLQKDRKGSDSTVEVSSLDVELGLSQDFGDTELLHGL